MLNINAFIGQPLNFKGKLKIYPPQIKDVVGNNLYGVFLRILTMDQDDVKDELKKNNPDMIDFPTPYEFLLGNCYQSKEFQTLTNAAFEYFCHTGVTFLYEDKKIIIGKAEELVQNVTNVSQISYLLEEDFFDFQNTIRLACGDAPKKPPEPIDPNEDPRVRRIKEKARERDRIKAKNGVQGGISFDTTLVAICCMGIGITPLNIGEMSYASIGPIMKMMQDKEKYDIDIRSLLAGADSKKIKPKYWIRNEEK